MVVISLTGVRAYGEIEYWLSVLKVFTIMMFIVCGILVDTGAISGLTYGSKSRSYGGTPFIGGFLPLLRPLTQSVTPIVFFALFVTGRTLTGSRFPPISTRVNKT
ncbi:hypothetical protein KI688_011956 [Linnemannia hyalina]|uniref:Amino acid permease/ SLC12A domain-containing protein n=1 Tax=Linnemannia hyalina TaxID=64524 RepID=A0A9P7XTT6_9FUNG|nr:hypothetical protein KI688_011956 [Linnemannia hyalina]